MKQTDNQSVELFEEFFLTYYPKVKGFAIKLLQNEEDAADVAQEIFIKIWKQPEIWCSNEYNDSYIYAMTRNYIFNIIRRNLIEKKYQDHTIKSTLESVDYTTDFEEKLYSKELELILKLKIENMPPQRRHIFKLSRFEGKSNKDIADKLNLSIRTVERHIHLALTELKEIPLFLIFLWF